MISPSFPVAVETYEYRNNGTEIYYPQITECNDAQVQSEINQQIEQAAFRLVSAQQTQQNVETFDQMIGLYEIKTNERNVLSLTLTNYAIHAYFAHGLTIMATLNFDLETGKNQSLSDQFKPESDYESRLIQLINKQIKARELPVFDQPITISPEQGFYIADKAFVIYYQLYEISPYYAGLPMFPISVYKVEDMLGDTGLLTRMLA